MGKVKKLFHSKNSTPWLPQQAVMIYTHLLIPLLFLLLKNIQNFRFPGKGHTGKYFFSTQLLHFFPVVLLSHPIDLHSHAILRFLCSLAILGSLVPAYADIHIDTITMMGNLDYIKHYFNLGLTFNNILEALSVRHNVIINMKTQSIFCGKRSVSTVA